MTLVRIISDWDWPDLRRQSPGGEGRWGEIEFTLGDVLRCDYCIVLNYVPKPTRVECPPDRVWALMQEPPNEVFGPMHRGTKAFARILTQDTSLRSPRYVHSQPALPWHVNKTYDQLRNCPPPEKTCAVSWITSNKTSFDGHRARLEFLEELKQGLEFDLFGRGFRPIEDKWDGLATYRYSIAVENFRNPFYWSEKLADCFLAWCMPIYYGCSRIGDYFPSEAIVAIDIGDPFAIERIREALAEDKWRRNLDAIAYARQLVLDRYQFFPFMTSQILAYENQSGRGAAVHEAVTLHYQEPLRRSLLERLPTAGRRRAAKMWSLAKKAWRE